MLQVKEGIKIEVNIFSHSYLAPSPPHDVSVSQNGLNSLLVTWTPSQGPDVTGYTIYYQQQDGGPSGSVEAGQYDTSITIPGLTVGATYSISIVANSSTLPSTVTTGPSATTGSYTTVYTFPDTPIAYRASHHLSYSLLYHSHGWRLCHSHLHHLSTQWSNWYPSLPVGGAWSSLYSS